MKPKVDANDHRNAEIAESALFPAENPNPVFRVSPDGRLMYANRASGPLLAAWRMAAGGLVPRVWRERLAGVLASGEAQQWDEPCGDRILQLNCVPIVSMGYVNVYASDVTERVALLARLTVEQDRLAEQARLAEQRAAELEATLEAITDGVVLYDREGRVMRLNDSATRILGYDPAQSELPLTQRAALIEASIVDDPDAPVDRFPLPRALRGETVRSQLMQFRPAGEPEGATRYVLSSAVPIADGGGARLGVVASFSDVTELRRAQDELERRVQERTAQVVEQARALEKANEELHASREQLRALSRRLVAMQEAERGYVADQLYNQVGQVLAALQFRLARVDEEGRAQLPAINATLSEAIGELHELASRLHPVLLDRSSLARALNALAVEFGSRHGLAIRYQPGDAEHVRTTRDVTTAMFRAAQEGLANVAHHAQATEIRLSLRRDGEMLIVTLADNGIGFDPERAALTGSLGLASMHERLKTIGGQLIITSGHTGTTLRMEAPLSIEEKAV